jgi:hypothetical protein
MQLFKAFVGVYVGSLSVWGDGFLVSSTPFVPILAFQPSLPPSRYFPFGVKPVVKDKSFSQSFSLLVSQMLCSLLAHNLFKMFVLQECCARTRKCKT